MSDSSRSSNYKFFCHKTCEYFPCHPKADKDNFNCLFCYCPLYALGAKCGGDFQYTSTGVKDCSNCLFPHIPENYDKIVSRFEEIRELTDLS